MPKKGMERTSHQETQKESVQSTEKLNLLKKNAERLDKLTPIAKEALQEVYGKDNGEKHAIDKFFSRGEKKENSELQKKIEYDVEKHIVSKHTNISVENLNQLSKIDEGYVYKDKDGEGRILEKGKTYENKNGEKVELTKEQMDKINKDLSSLELDKVPIPTVIETTLLDHVAKQANDDNLKKGIVYDHSYNKQTNQLKVYVVQEVNEAKDGSGANKIKDEEMKEFSIELSSPEKRSELENEVKKEFFARQVINDIKPTDPNNTIEDVKSNIILGEDFNEHKDGTFPRKIHDHQKEELEKVLSSLWRSDKTAPASDVNGNDSREGTRSTVGEQRNITDIFPKNKDQSEDIKDQIEELYKEGDRIKKQGDRISNFMGFMNIFNNVSMQATGNLEVLVDRMLQTEGNPNSMQGMYNPSQFIHDAYNRKIDQKLHANRSEINIRKQELRHANDGKEGKEKIQKQLKELENQVKQEEHGSNAEQEEIGDKANKRKVVNDDKKDENEEKEQ